MSTAVNNVGGIVSLSGMTTTQIMDLLRNYILTYFGENIAVHDQVSTTQTVFKCQASSRSIPFYFYVSVDSSNVNLSNIFRYWNISTHTGSGYIGYTQSVNHTYNSSLYIFISQNIFYIHQAHGAYCALDANEAGIIWAMPAHYPDVAALTTAAVSNGYTVEIPVDNITNFFVGMKVAIADSGGTGWCYGIITAIGQSSLTISTLYLDLAVGSSICVPPSLLIISSDAVYRAIDERTLIAANAISSILTTSILPLLNNSVFAKDAISRDIYVSPMAWYTSFGSAYHDINAALCSGSSGSLNDFLARNADGSAPVSGTATTGDRVVLIDTGKSWTPSGLIGKYVAIIAGTDDGLCRKIVANTETSITVDTPFFSALDSTSSYVIADTVYRYVDFGNTMVALRESW